MHISNLPYDVRYQIYQQLFPRSPQIYLGVVGNNNLKAIIPEGQVVPLELLLTSRAIHAEAIEYLYNNYLFNIIGTKRDCLANYKSFLRTLEKYARNEVHVHAFSNGSHSATICISLLAGDARMSLLKRRERGEPKAIADIESEIAVASGLRSILSRASRFPWRSVYFELLVAISCFLIAILSIWTGIS